MTAVQADKVIELLGQILQVMSANTIVLESMHRETLRPRQEVERINAASQATVLQSAANAAAVAERHERERRCLPSLWGSERGIREVGPGDPTPE